MYKLPLLLLISAAFCQNPPNNENMTNVLLQIFGTPDNPNTNIGSIVNTGTSLGPNSGGSTGDLGSVLGVPKPVPVDNKSQGPSTIVPFVNNNEVGTVEECMLPDGGKGECVSYYLCNSTTNEVIRDGAGVIDIRVNDGACNSYIDACCGVGDKRPPTDPIKPTPKPDQLKNVDCNCHNSANLPPTSHFNLLYLTLTLFLTCLTPFTN